VRRFAFAAFAALCCAFSAHAAPDGIPRQPLSIGNWFDHDPTEPVAGNEPWTPSDVAGFMALYPDAYFEIGYTLMPGTSKIHTKAAQLDELRAQLAQRGVDASARLCVVERPDVFPRMLWNSESCAPWRQGGGCDWEASMSGRHGEAETVVKASGRATGGSANAVIDDHAHFQTDLYVHRLLVLRPGSASEERHRVVQNEGQMLVVDGTWSEPPMPGDEYKVLGSFDTAWVRRVSTAAHDAALQRYWTSLRNVCNGPCAPPAEPLDPFVAKRGFEAWIDHDAIGALRTATTVPALYGYIYDGDQLAGRQLHDPYFRANTVVMDLSNHAYRVWKAQNLIYVLEDLGFKKDDDVCLLVGYKPGFHTYNDPAVNGVMDHPCADPQSHNWIGPSHVCPKGLIQNGPFHGTPYGPGEFETAISDYFRDLFATTAAQGWNHIRVISAEAPPYKKSWSDLAADVRHMTGMYGVQGGWIEPKLAVLSNAPPDPAATGTDGTPPQPTTAETTPPQPTTAETNPPPASEPPPAAGPPPASDPPLASEPPPPVSVPVPVVGSPTPEPPPAASGGVEVSGSGDAVPRAAPRYAPAPAAMPPAEPKKKPRGGYVEKSSDGGADGEVDPPTKE
jgi:hypothetical protein